MKHEAANDCIICGYKTSHDVVVCDICAKALEVHNERMVEQAINCEKHRRHLVRMMRFPLAFDVCDRKNFSVWREREPSE